MTMYQNRTEAGRHLATPLMIYANRPEVVVLALPRGGVPVALAVAEALNAPLDVFLVRKLGLPGHEELAMGAIATGGVRVLNETVVRALHNPDTVIDAVARQEQQELERRERLYRKGRPALAVRGCTVLLVDDGLATGSTMRAAAVALRQRHPACIVVAVPVAASRTCEALRTEVDDIVCAVTPEPLYAVGRWYADFAPTGDAEVRNLLAQAAQRPASVAQVRGDGQRG
jgi:predicted phosphoribosyltransferase